MARPTLLTPQIEERILAAVRSGIPFGSACELAGISESTGRKWLARGRDAADDEQQEALYVAFHDRVRKAAAEHEAQAVLSIRRAAMGDEVWREKRITRTDGTVVVERTRDKSDWRAAAWWLERRYPELWGAKVEHRIVAAKVESELTAALSRLEAALPPDLYRTVLEVLTGEDAAA